MLLQLWTELGFQNTVYHDVSAPDIEKHFSELAKSDHSAFDCLIVSILTHGLDGGRIYTSDGEVVSLEKLLKYFYADKAHKSLIGKPKLFFIQVSEALFLLLLASDCVAYFPMVEYLLHVVEVIGNWLFF